MFVMSYGDIGSSGDSVNYERLWKTGSSIL